MKWVQFSFDFLEFDSNCVSLREIDFNENIFAFEFCLAILWISFRDYLVPVVLGSPVTLKFRRAVEVDGVSSLLGAYLR